MSPAFIGLHQDMWPTLRQLHWPESWSSLINLSHARPIILLRLGRIHSNQFDKYAKEIVLPKNILVQIPWEKKEVYSLVSPKADHYTTDHPIYTMGSYKC